jgi:hypothetical protein
MKSGKTVGTYRTADVTEDEVLGMIIAGKKVTRPRVLRPRTGRLRNKTLPLSTAPAHVRLLPSPIALLGLAVSVLMATKRVAPLRAKG